MIQAQTTSRRRLPTAAPALALAALALVAGPVASQPLERLPIVDQAIAFHGGERYRSTDVELDLCSKSGCYQVRSRIDRDRFVYQVEGTVRGEHRHVRWTQDALEVRIDGKTIEPAPEDAQRWRDWVMERIYFAFLPYRLNDPSVFKQDQDLEQWGDRALRRVKVTFAPGSSTDADDEYAFWFDPETARLEQFAYSYQRNEGGLRFRRLVNYRRVGGILFFDQENLGVNGREYRVDQITPEFVDETLRSISRVRLENITVRDLDDVAWFFPSRSAAIAEAEHVLSATPAPATARNGSPSSPRSPTWPARPRKRSSRRRRGDVDLKSCQRRVFALHFRRASSRNDGRAFSD